MPIDDLTQNEEQLSDRINKLVNELPHDRESTRQRIDQQQAKQKLHHDQQIKRHRSFQIGDKVLLYKAEKAKQWSGKLDEKWKGPYYIHAVLQNESYKIRNMQGKVLKAPFNGSLLKPYYDQKEWNLPIID